MRYVLLVDDDVDHLRALGKLLELDGFAVTAVSDPDRAIALLSERRFQVVLSDLEMPQRSGLEVLAAASGNQPGARLFLATGNTDVELDLPAGVKVLYKPLDYDVLLTMLPERPVHEGVGRSVADIDQLDPALQSVATLADSFADALFVVSRERRVITVNEAAVKIFRASADELLMPTLDYPERFDLRWTNGQRSSPISGPALEGRMVEPVLMTLGSGSERRFLRSSAGPVRDRTGAVVGAVCLVTDVTSLRDEPRRIGWQESIPPSRASLPGPGPDGHRSRSYP